MQLFAKMYCVLFLVILGVSFSFGQRTYLRADGDSTNTYLLLNSVLGGTAYEVPDCEHSEMHITQHTDGELGVPVFNFRSHVDYDNDRCINFDRTRTEIKTYGPSPDHMKGFYGDSVSYSWDVRLNSQFQPSTAFTHIFQVKAVDGDDSQPFITITPRLYTGGRQSLQVIHSGVNSASNVIWEGDLTIYIGRWIHITVEYLCATQGSFHIRIKRKDNDLQLMTYTNNNLEMWRTGNSFQRPKWGIYRSLNNRVNLRDEFVYFNNFCFAKGEPKCN